MAGQAGRFAPRCVGDPVHRPDGLPMAGLAARLSTLFDDAGLFYAWRDYGFWQRIVDALARQARRRLGREPSPTAAVIDSQSAQRRPPADRAASTRQARTRARAPYRHQYQRAFGGRPGSSCQRSGRAWRRPLAPAPAGRFPALHYVFADRIYRGKGLLALARCGPWTIEIVERSAGVKGFPLLPPTGG